MDMESDDVGGMVLETFVSFDYLTWLTIREDFIDSGRRESFNTSFNIQSLGMMALNSEVIRNSLSLYHYYNVLQIYI